MDLPTEPSCLYCRHRIREDIAPGLKCKAFPDGIPEHIYDYLHPDYKSHPCKKFEFEPLNTKYNYIRAIFVGVIYLVSWLAGFDGDWSMVMSVFLIVLLWYELEVHNLKKERDMYLDRWRKYKLLLYDAEETINKLGQPSGNR